MKEEFPSSDTEKYTDVSEQAGSSRERLQQLAEEADETRQRTDRLEGELERDLIEGGHPDSSRWRSKRKKLLNLFLAGAMFLGAHGKIKGDVDNREGKPPKPTNITEQGHDLEGEREMIKRSLIERVNFDLMAIAEKAGFEPQIEVDNGSGKYIIHIGQSHYFPGAEETTTSQRIIQVQKKIEQLLLSIQSRDKRPLDVFNEGVTEARFKQNQYAKNEKILSEIKPGRLCFVNTLAQYNLHVSFYSDGPFRQTLTQMYRRKLDELKAYYADHPEHYHPVKTRRDIEYARKELNFYPLSGYDYSDDYSYETSSVQNDPKTSLDSKQLNKDNSYDNLPPLPSITEFTQEYELVQGKIISKLDAIGPEAIYLGGAAEKLSAEGKVTIIGAETQKGNKAAFEDEDKIEIAQKNYRSTGDDKFYREYLRLKEIQRIKVFDDREDIALERIEKEKRNISAPKTIHLVFGDAHMFADNVLKWNSAHPNKKIGLIRLTPVSPASITIIP